MNAFGGLRQGRMPWSVALQTKTRRFAVSMTLLGQTRVPRNGHPVLRRCLPILRILIGVYMVSPSTIFQTGANSFHDVLCVA